MTGDEGRTTDIRRWRWGHGLVLSGVEGGGMIVFAIRVISGGQAVEWVVGVIDSDSGRFGEGGIE